MKTKSPSISPKQTYGLLTILNLSTQRTSRPYWDCRCKCGKLVTVRADDLKAGKSTSCGCTRFKHGHTAGHSRSPTYLSWQDMVQRANSEGNPKRKRADIHPPWRDFNVFLRDMGERPPNTTIDRINPMGSYSPQNCRWSTSEQQRDNQIRTSRLTYDNGSIYWKRTVREWAEFISGQTKKEWTPPFLKEVLKHLTIEQVISAISIYRRTPEELVAERLRRARADSDAAIRGLRTARHGPGYIPTPSEPATNDEIDAAVKHLLCGSDFEDEPEQIDNGLPTNLSPAALEAIADMEHFTIYY